LSHLSDLTLLRVIGDHVDVVVDDERDLANPVDQQAVAALLADNDSTLTIGGSVVSAMRHRAPFWANFKISLAALPGSLPNVLTTMTTRPAGGTTFAPRSGPLALALKSGGRHRLRRCSTRPPAGGPAAEQQPDSRANRSATTSTGQ
jgi:hypothetical protein